MNRIKEEREHRFLSISDVADVLGVHENTIRGWERGEFEPSGKNLVQLLKLYGCSPDYLLLLDDEKGCHAITRE